MNGYIDNDYMHSKQYKDELDVFSMCKIKEIYQVDERGDVVTNNNNIPIVIGENNPAPLEIEVGNYFHKLNGVPNLLPCNIHNGFSDVYGIDSYTPHTEDKWFSLRDKDGNFMGGTWIYIKDKDCGMYAIRSSLANVLTGKKGIGRELLNAVIEYAKKNGCERLVAVWPLETLVPLLEKFDFKFHYNPLPVTNYFCSGSKGHYVLEILK